MKEKDFSFYNHYSTAVLVFDSTGKIVFKNQSFIYTFGNIKNLEKFTNYFSFDVCILDSENILEANPINFALASKETFYAHTVYQKSKDKFLHFKLTALVDGDYKIIGFYDLTSDVLYENLQLEHNNLQHEYQNLKRKNEEYQITQKQAQTQAIKMALMHRVSNTIRESIDLSKIIDSALKELSNLFGAVKVYYASYENDKFIINQAYPLKSKTQINDIIELENNTKKDIFSKNISVTPCRKEYLNSKSTFLSSVSRVIVPVYRLNNILGILMIYTHKPVDAQIDILQSISAQLASAIVQASLFQEISRKNEELESTLKELKETQLQLINAEKMASLGQLVAGVAHEINTPLASINSNNDILEKLINKIESKDEKLLKTFDSIIKIDKEAIKRINQLVKGLKKFIRLDESELQETDINKELDLTLDLIRHETKNKINVIKKYSQIPQIKCYPNMLNQVFMNVLINACHSIKDEGEITIETEYSGNNLFVKIKDNGCGIDDDLKDKMFTAGTTTKKTGTGLGLAISQKIIEKHKGQIIFNSEKNKGAEFIIKIPNN